MVTRKVIATSGSASFGTGMWGASASMSATVGYVKSDKQFTREDIALRAGLRSKVDIGFHTEPVRLDRMAPKRTIDRITERSKVPDVETNLLAGTPGSGSLLGKDVRSTEDPSFDDIPKLPDKVTDPGSDEQRKLREKKDFGPPKKEAEKADTGTKEADTGTKETDTGTKETDTGTPKPEAGGKTASNKGALTGTANDPKPGAKNK